MPAESTASFETIRPVGQASMRLRLVPALSGLVDRLRARTVSPTWYGMVLAIAAAYFLNARIGLHFAMQGGVVTPVWPPSGIAVAALLLFGRHLWPGVWIGAFVANLGGIVSQLDSGPLLPALASAIGMSSGATLNAWIAAGLVGRITGGRHPLDKVRDVVLTLLLGGPLACMISASLGAASLTLTGFAPFPAFGQIWLTWWLGDTAGVIVLTPLLLAWATRHSRDSRPPITESIVCAAMLVAAGYVVFVADEVSGFSGKPLIFILMPALVWPALRFGQRGAATAALVIAGLSVYGTTNGVGPFQLSSLNESLLVLELFLITVSAVALCVSAVVAEQQAAEASRNEAFAELEARVQERTADLAASETRFRRLADTAPVHIWMSGPDGRYNYVNRVWLEFTGRTLEDEIGDGWTGRMHPDDREHWRKGFLAALKDHRAFELEYRLQRSDGEYRWFLVHGSPRFRADGDHDGFIGTGFDITDHRAAEEAVRQSQKMESIGLLAGGVAHDFNNILTIIEGHADLLEDDADLDEDRGDSVREISLAASRATHLTRQLLTFSRRQIMQPRTLDLGEVVAGMTKMLTRVLGDDIELHFGKPAGLPGVRADIGMIEQALLNLSLNARKAMPDGGRLDIDVRLVDVPAGIAGSQPGTASGPHMRITVSDTGCGIAPENLPHVFEPFFTTRSVGQGTGLGLATVYGIVQEHKGWIEVSSEVGKGAEFRIHLPVSGGEVESYVSSRSDPVPKAATGNERILVVEDEPSVLRMAVRALNRCGYRTLEAESGVAALKLMNETPEPVDLLLSDVVMPGGIGGIRLAEQLQEKQPGLKVILASGYSEETLGDDFAPGENLRFLQKPYTASVLAAAIRDSLDGAHGP